MVFISILILEMIFKFLARGIKLYFNDKFNLFDFVIILLNLIDLAFE